MNKNMADIAIELTTPKTSQVKDIVTSHNNQDISDQEADGIVSSLFNTAEFIRNQNFDYVLVTGSSRLILRPLLAGLPLGNAKVIILDADQNQELYMRPQLVPISERRRLETTANGPHTKPLEKEKYREKAQWLKKILLEKGIDLEGKKMLLLEDHISSGYKTREYLNILAELTDLRDYAFGALLKSEDEEKVEKVVGADMPRVHYFGDLGGFKNVELARVFSRMKSVDARRTLQPGDRNYNTPERRREMRDIILFIRQKIRERQ